MIERQYAYLPGRLAPHKDPATNFARKNELFYPDGTPRYNINWQKEATRTAFSTNSSLTFSGGKENMTSLVNISYKRQEGIMMNSALRQINLFANLGMGSEALAASQDHHQWWRIAIAECGSEFTWV